MLRDSEEMLRDSDEAEHPLPDHAEVQGSGRAPASWKKMDTPAGRRPASPFDPPG